jgi:4-diphosphocytidyl-2-C-methyl-D-erythritol kinase
MTSAAAYAKINLGLVVGPVRANGKHEVATVLERVDLHDVVAVERAEMAGIVVDGFPEDTLVRSALAALAAASNTRPAWHVQIEKRIPVAAGLGGGSSDAAAALELANGLLPQPLAAGELRELAVGLGADVPFFLADGPQLATADGSELTPITLPLDFRVLLVLPGGEEKESTREIYERFDELHGVEGFEARGAALRGAVARITEPRDLATLPRNDLVSSPLAFELERLGSFRADVSGAGPMVYALFEDTGAAERAAAALTGAVGTWLTRPVERR